MKHLAKICLFLLLLGSVALPAYAGSSTFLLNNHSATTNVQATVYVYPDANQNFYVPHYLAVSNAQCSGAPYYSCQIPSGLVATLLVKQLPHTSNTKFCVSANAPTGHFQDCSGDACMVAVTNGQAQLEGNCSHYELLAQTIKTV